MASEKDQFARDFEEVSKLLTRYPQIRIDKTEGSPPAVYEIAYRLKGLTRTADGSIGQADRHLLRINLPFGYPHFPPTVKPLTPLFHPDIDPDAVRIASYWQQQPSLAKLVLRIGEMICARDYTLEEPFNQEAADWYSEHANDFPLDEIRQGEVDIEADELSMEGGDDLSFGLELDIPEQQEEEESDFGLHLEPADTPDDTQLQEIRQHIDRHEVVTAGKLLATLSSSSPEAQRLGKIVSAALAERDKLLKRIEELENEDRFADAYKIFKKVQAIAVDTPALSDIGHRLQQSQAMLDAFSRPNRKTNRKADEQASLPPDLPTGKKGAKKKKNAGQGTEQGTDQAVPPKAPKPARAPIEIPLKSILIGLTLLALVAGGTVLSTNEMDKMMEIERQWIEIKYRTCRTPEQFQEKRIHSEQLLVQLKSVHLPWLGRKKLAEEIRNILDSEKFKKGESGNREYKGVPLPAPVIEKLLPLDEKIDKAASAAEKEEFAKALSLYQDALTLAEKVKPSPSDPQFEIITEELDKRTLDIKTKLPELREQDQQEKEREKQRKIEEQYDNAIDFFEKTKEKGNDFSESESDDLDAGDTWSECIKRLLEAERILNEHPEINSRDKQKKIRTFLAYSRLYQYLDVAHTAYKEGAFDRAINKYQNALDLLNEERLLFDAFYQKAVLKIRRTVVMLKITLELRKAVEAENRNNLRDALASYKEVLRIIRTSQEVKDNTLKKLEQYISTKIDGLSLERAKSSSREWWLKNYESIFKKEFPSIRLSLLSKPGIQFVRIENGRLLYRIWCSEKGGVNFELKYQYDLETGRWSPYRGKL